MKTELEKLKKLAAEADRKHAERLASTVYVLCPGPVASRNDRDWHHISAQQLARLYGVKMRDCITMSETFREQPGVKYVYLKPRYSGDYRLPTDEGGEP